MADGDGAGDTMEVVNDDGNASGTRNAGTPKKGPPPVTAARKRAMPKLQLFDLVAGGAFERALEGMGRQEGGEVSDR